MKALRSGWFLLENLQAGMEVRGSFGVRFLHHCVTAVNHCHISKCVYSVCIYVYKESYRSPIHFCGRTQLSELVPFAELGTLSSAGDARNTTYVERRTPENIILGRESYWSLDNQHVIYWSSQDGAGYPGYPAQYLMWKMWNMWKMCRAVGPRKNTFGTVPMYVMYVLNVLNHVKPC